MNTAMNPDPTTGSALDPSALRLERRDRDLEAQLSHAKQEQERIRRKLQQQLLTVTLEKQEGEKTQRDLETRLETALTERNDARAERDQIRQDLQDLIQDLEARLASALAERSRMEKDHEDRLALEDRRRLQLGDELGGVYKSLSWRLTAPLRWLNSLFSRRKHR